MGAPIAGLDTPPPEADADRADALPDVDGAARFLPDAPADIDDATRAAGDGPPLPPLDDAAVDPPWSWDQQVRRLIDRSTLGAALREAGYVLPEGAAVFAARIVPGVDGPAYVLYQAGTGAFSKDFWPASTVKVLAALAALDFVRSLGFTGAAQVTFDPGTATATAAFQAAAEAKADADADADTDADAEVKSSDTLRAIIDRAVRISSNADYDLTVLVAGLDRLNETFLAPANGFPWTILERSYTGNGVRDSPGFTLAEGTRVLRVEPRRGRAEYGCPEHGNCASLFELTEAVRRVVLRDEIPPAERFALDPADLAALTDALCNTESSYFLDGARRAFGVEPRICHKTGSVRDRDFLDHGLLENPATGARYLLAASLPDQGGATESKAALSELAEQVLRFLLRQTGGFALQPDAGVPLAVQLDRAEGTPRRSPKFVLTVDAPGADAIAAFVDGRPLGTATGAGPRFVTEPLRLPWGDRLLVVTASRNGVPIGYRGLHFRNPAPRYD
jgi:hypothetical protein